MGALGLAFGVLSNIYIREPTHIEDAKQTVTLNEKKEIPKEVV